MSKNWHDSLLCDLAATINKFPWLLGVYRLDIGSDAGEQGGEVVDTSIDECNLALWVAVMECASA
jgi:hypothetical protein